MQSVPGAVATGSQLIARIEIAGMVYPVAIAPGTDLIPSVWSHEVEISSGAFHYQSIRIRFVVLATKHAVIHKS